MLTMDNGCQDWRLPQLGEALDSWTRKNPITSRQNKIQKYLKAIKLKVEINRTVSARVVKK